MAAPVFTYDAYIISPGVDLTLTGVGTPNLTATYGDYGGVGEGLNKKATCTIALHYADVQYTINPDNSVTVTGTILGDTLTRTRVASSTNTQEVTVWFNGQEVFHRYIGTSTSGSWDLNLPATFSVTIPPSENPQPQYPASIHFKNHNTGTTNPPDEFYFGLGITNPNPPDYRPGATLDSGSVWQSHNRSVGKAHIRTSGGIWREMRTHNGHTDSTNPPSIRMNNKWVNQNKLGKNG